MSLTAPQQERSVDPYSENRFSSVINRLSRIVTGGNDCVLFSNQSFMLTRIDWRTIKVYPGICIKDDVLIHIQQEFELLFDDNDYYIDEEGEMTLANYYYIVLQYFYARTLPAPKAYLRIIRDIDNLYTPYTNRYVFLGCANVIYNVGLTRYELDVDPNCTFYSDPNNTSIQRPLPESDWLNVDGGEI